MGWNRFDGEKIAGLCPPWWTKSTETWEMAVMLKSLESKSLFVFLYHQQPMEGQVFEWIRLTGTTVVYLWCLVLPVTRGKNPSASCFLDSCWQCLFFLKCLFLFCVWVWQLFCLLESWFVWIGTFCQDVDSHVYFKVFWLICKVEGLSVV